MSQETFDTFRNEIYAKLPSKNNISEKTDVYLLDDTWTSYLLELNGYGPGKLRGDSISW